MIDLLIAEDEHADLFLIQQACREAGLECRWHHAADGEQALALLEQVEQGQFRPAAILLDINLPRYSGKELLLRIRSNPLFDKVPVLVMSGTLNPRDRAEVLRMGAQRFFQKTLDLDDYMRIGVEVRKLMEQ